MAKKQPPASTPPAAAPTKSQGKAGAAKAQAPAPAPAPPDPTAGWNNDEILARICDGDRLTEIADDLGVKLTVLLRWTQRPEVKEAYVATKELRAHAAVERIRTTLFEVKTGQVDPQAGKLIVDTERWLAAKLSPKDYSEKTETTVNHNVTSTVEALKALSAAPVPPLPPMPVPIEEDVPAVKH